MSVGKFLLAEKKGCNIGTFLLSLGCFARRRFGSNSDEVLVNVKKQAARVDEKYGLEPQINRNELLHWLIPFAC
jgi:hypothetical protein